MNSASPRRYGRTNATRAEADRLAADGHHVHLVSSGETRCHTGHCHTPQH
ncbi:hypothetical protein [Streptomyces sp. CB01580]|nr:hypothetical protein [Streptomyces sp. CB01580]